MPDADILESIVASGQKKQICDITNARIGADNADNWKIWLK